MSEHKLVFPTVALRGISILPGNIAHFDVSRHASIKALEDAMASDQKVLLVTQKNTEVSQPGPEDLYDVGVIADVKQVIKLPGGLVRVIAEGVKRARVLSMEMGEHYLSAVAAEMPAPDLANYSDVELEAMAGVLHECFARYAAANPKMGKEYVAQVMTNRNPLKIIQLISNGVLMPYEQKQRILESFSLEAQFELIQEILTHETEVLQIKMQYQQRVKTRVEANQKEYFLREEMKEIKKELGEDEEETDIDQLKSATDELPAKEYVKEKLHKEIRRLARLSPNSSESGVVRSYIETMLELPWDKMSEDREDLVYAAQVLDEDHYGLEKVKERVIEFLAVRMLKEKTEGDSQIICLVGPPGTGKTSIARSVARALNKEYVRISLGGVKDEAEIRGHRKTYVGAMPGRIVYGLRQAGVCNPLMLLDEIDKTGKDYLHDTSAALLEVLDGEQNCRFRDHYIEVPIDLSRTFFIATANSLQDIPKPLLDRMEVIEIAGYTENEKFHIAKEYLVKKQIEKAGLKPEQLKISDNALRKIILFYTKEAGVRELERKIAQVCRKTARQVVEKKQTEVLVTESNLNKYLGKVLYHRDETDKEPQVGIVQGLAWTAVGGVTLEIEVNVMPGKGEMTLTGQLGDVMKESAVAALSYIRSISEEQGIESDFYQTHDIHIHIPEGAVPKDGPSAGITLATAMYSAITGKKVKGDIAMTGEITLRGRVLPIGGVKEKILAAKNAGIFTVCVPNKNEADVKEISAEIMKNMDIRYVKTMDEVLKHALA